MAPSSFKKIGAAVAYASLVKATTESYQLSEEYTTDNFFDKFDFFTSTYTSGDSWDATHGFVQYRSQADAESLGLISTTNGQIYIGPDHNSTYDVDGKGRDSVRITSKSTYNGGLLVAKFTHMPVQACGAWPAFWSYASPWLTSGEIDFYEGWNLMGYNRIAMHVNETIAGACTLSTTDIAGTVTTDDCNNSVDGTGCGVTDTADVWGSTTGATFAWEWTDSAIKIWTWTPSNVPADITAGTPDPTSDAWGQPQLLVEQSNCDLTKAFGDLQLTFNIDFCGDTAGSPSIWNQTCSAQGSSCTSYVANNPSAFTETYFSIEGIQFYEMKAVAVASVPASSSSAVAVTSSAALAATTSSTVPAVTTTSSSSLVAEGGLLAGTGSLLDSTLGVSATTSQIPAASTDQVAVEATSHAHSTSYIYGTSTLTDETGSETTVIVVVDTTICPVTAAEASATSTPGGGSVVAAQTTPVPETTIATTSVRASSAVPSSSSTQFTTSTIFSTSSSTITSCASTASACTTGDVTTVVVAISTTICPVTAAEGSSSTKASTSVSTVSTGTTAETTASPVSSKPVAAAATAAASTSHSVVTKTSAVTLLTSKTVQTSASSTASTEVETATDTAGALEVASGTPTGTAIYGSTYIGNMTGTITASASSSTETSTCAGLDCIVVSSSGHKIGNVIGTSGLALAVFAGVMFLF